MKTLLIYEKLVSLNRAAHRDLKLAPSEQKFSFARETNSVLVACAELPQAALDFPCVFIETEGGHALAALVGLRDHENLFVQDDGSWAPGSYLPAFFRRYPFVLAESAGSDEYTVCLDQAYPGLGNSEGQPLFDEQGRETAWLEEVKRFLIDFRQEMTSSSVFANRLAELGLLEDRVIEYTVDGEPATLRGFKALSEKKLRALSTELQQELFANGWMGLIYAHLLSLNQVPRLALRHEQRRTMTQQAPPAERQEPAALAT